MQLKEGHSLSQRCSQEEPIAITWQVYVSNSEPNMNT